MWELVGSSTYRSRYDGYNPDARSGMGWSGRSARHLVVGEKCVPIEDRCSGLEYRSTGHETHVAGGYGGGGRESGDGDVEAGAPGVGHIGEVVGRKKVIRPSRGDTQDSGGGGVLDQSRPECTQELSRGESGVRGALKYDLVGESNVG